jgi:hypothetical protein
MNFIAIAFAITLGQTVSDPTIQKSDLPLSPLEHKQIVVAEGMDFTAVTSDDKVFDPNKEMPSVSSSANGRTVITWQPTPDKYIVTDDQLVQIIEPRKDEPLFHTIEAIRYREKKPWMLLTQVSVLLFDHHIFCIWENDLENSPADFSCGDILSTTGNHMPTLDVGQYESGTGAYNAHARFELSAKGPILVGISRGGRTGK